jgi:Protein of unknown function (DUF1552)
MQWNRRSRRHFLQGAGAVLALPLLRSLLPFDLERVAKADTTPKSFIGIAAFNGLYRMYGPEAQLMPRTPENAKTLVGYQPYAVPNRHTIYHESLTNLATANGGKISDIVDASFTPLLGKMTMLQGFDFLGMGYYHHHGQFGNWHKTAQGTEGNPNMATLDVVLSDYKAKAGQPSDLVAYSASSRDIQYGASFRADGTLTTSRFSNPATLWDKYFGNSTVPTDFRALLVDKVLADYNALKNNPRLGSEDRRRLEAHIAHLATTEAKVKQIGAVCQQLRPNQSISDRALVLKTMNDVIVGLISCGMCNVFLGWAEALLNEDPDQWHVWSHQGYSNDTDAIADATSYTNMVEQSRAVMKDMCLDLAQKLDQVGQLDNALIVCIQEHSKRGHESWNVPVITFGSAGGALATNQYIDYRNIADRDDKVFTRYGFPMNQLYANVLAAMGMTPSEFEALNKTRSDGVSPFKASSGYGVPSILPDDSQMISYYKSWTGHDMSGPLPLLRA